MYDLHKYIDTWNGQRLYLYIVVLIFVLWYFSKQNIGLNVLIAMIIGAFIISYLNNRSITSTDTEDEIQKIKLENIKPNITKNTIEHKDITDFLFSIQDMYVYNPLQYEEMIKFINIFYEKYNMSFIDPSTSSDNYELMKQSKRDSINSLTSLVFSLPDNTKIRHKLNISASTLDHILTKYLDQISYLVDEQIYKKGYNIDTKIIDHGPKAHNEYSDIYANFTYETV